MKPLNVSMIHIRRRMHRVSCHRMKRKIGHMVGMRITMLPLLDQEGLSLVVAEKL